MLPLSNVINISVSQSPQGLGEYNVNNVALFTDDAPLVSWDTDYRVYVSPSDVATDFGTNSDTYAQAVAFFSQAPNVLNGGGCLIIFPAETTTDGRLETVGITAPGSGYAVNDVLTVGGAGTLGTLKVTAISGTGQVLQVSILTGGSDYVVASGVATTVAPSGGTGCTINVTAVSSTESLLDAINRVKDEIFFVGIISTFLPSGSDRLTTASAIQAMGDKIWLLPSATYSDVAGVFTAIKDALDTRTRCLLYTVSLDDAKLMAAAYAGAAFSTNFDQANSTLTMNLKQLITIEPDEALTQTQYDAAKTAGVDLYVSYAGRPSVLSSGGNFYFDQVYNLVWFVSRLKVAGFNALARVTSKVPQTEPGMTLLKGAYRQVCEEARNNAYVAPGTWTSAETFGNQADFFQNIEQVGYYIYSQPVTLQSAEDREDRIAPIIRIAVKEAGAIQSSNVVVNINP